MGAQKMLIISGSRVAENNVKLLPQLSGDTANGYQIWHLLCTVQRRANTEIERQGFLLQPHSAVRLESSTPPASLHISLSRAMSEYGAIYLEFVAVKYGQGEEPSHNMIVTNLVTLSYNKFYQVGLLVVIPDTFCFAGSVLRAIVILSV